MLGICGHLYLSRTLAATVEHLYEQVASAVSYTQHHIVNRDQ